jgi:hypothetical protein
MAEEECWVGSGRDKSGYSLITINGKTFKAHRVFYEHLVGPIPEGLVLDHLCRNHACVNPAHLEPVSSRENTLRSEITEPYLNTKKEQCPNGHPYDSVDIEKGKVRRRKCSQCRKAWLKEYSKQKNARKKSNAQ